VSDLRTPKGVSRVTNEVAAKLYKKLDDDSNGSVKHNPSRTALWCTVNPNPNPGRRHLKTGTQGLLLEQNRSQVLFY